MYVNPSNSPLSSPRVLAHIYLPAAVCVLLFLALIVPVQNAEIILDHDVPLRHSASTSWPVSSPRHSVARACWWWLIWSWHEFSSSWGASTPSGAGLSTSARLTNIEWRVL